MATFEAIQIYISETYAKPRNLQRFVWRQECFVYVRKKICHCPKLSSYLLYFKRKTTFGHINAAEVAFLVFLIDFRYFVCIRICLP